MSNTPKLEEPTITEEPMPSLQPNQPTEPVEIDQVTSLLDQEGELLPIIIPENLYPLEIMLALGVTEAELRDPNLNCLSFDEFMEKTAFKDDPWSSEAEFDRWEAKMASQLKKAQDKQKAAIGFGAASAKSTKSKARKR